MLNGVRPATHSARTVSPLPRLALNGREAASFKRNEISQLDSKLAANEIDLKQYTLEKSRLDSKYAL